MEPYGKRLHRAARRDFKTHWSAHRWLSAFTTFGSTLAGVAIQMIVLGVGSIARLELTATTALGALAVSLVGHYLIAMRRGAEALDIESNAKIGAADAKIQEQEHLLEEREKNITPEMNCTVLDALFDDGPFTSTTWLTEEEEITTRLCYITLTVEFRNRKPVQGTIDRCSLVIETENGTLRPLPIREFGPEPSGAGPKLLRSFAGIAELEPNLAVTYGLTVTRFVSFAVQRRVPRDDAFETKGTFKLTVVDSFGKEYTAIRPPGPWPSNPMQQTIKRFGIPE